MLQRRAGVQDPDSSCRGLVILVDETVEHIASTDVARINRCRITLVCDGSGLQGPKPGS
jgi:hypothetical protein